MTFGSVQQFNHGLLTRAVAILAISGFATFTDSVNSVQAQDAKLLKAMRIKPKQAVDCENPSADVLKECTFAATKDPSGYIVHHSSGRILRRFTDHNSDNKLDQWSYYKNGLEVYRDIDSNYDGLTDGYRWVGPGGTRWGLDKDQNGSIDSWKVISAEEVAAECFDAIKNADQQRFSRLLLTSKEFSALGLGPVIAKDVSQRLQKARSGFLSMARGQKVIGGEAKFVDAGNGRPYMLAAGSFKSKRDLVVYDQASAFFDGGRSNQLSLGSLIKVGDVWRMIELPELVDPKTPLASGGAFFPLPDFGGGGRVATSENDQKLSDLYDQLTKVEAGLKSATGSQIEKLEQQKAMLLVQFYTITKDPKTKRDWLENLADSVASSYQADRFEGGIGFLNKFIADQRNSPGMDYVKWSSIFAEYGWANANGDRKQREQGYRKMIGQLKSFQKQYKSSIQAADALIQIAVHHEVNDSDEPEKAIEWYQNCLKRFPNTKFGRRAKGAIVRLDGFGKNLSVIGKTAAGKNFDTRSLRGKIVVLHFWETWCFSDEDVDELTKLAAKYKEDLVIVGCNVEGGRPGDANGEATERFRKFIKSNPDISWTQLHAPGSVEDSPLAHQLGIATEPVVFLVDKAGKLVESNIGISNLEREIVRERRRSKK